MRNRKETLNSTQLDELLQNFRLFINYVYGDLPEDREAYVESLILEYDEISFFVDNLLYIRLSTGNTKKQLVKFFENSESHILEIFKRRLNW